MQRPARKTGPSRRGENSSQLSETYRYILANLELNPSIQQGSQTILITSSSPGEGKTFTSLNLANTLAHAHKKVLLIDANMRAPQLHNELNLSVELGLSDVIGNGHDFRRALLSTSTPNLSLLPSGTPSHDASSFLSSAIFSDILMESKAMFDIVLIDSPSVLSVSDALVVARVVDGVVLVVDSKKTNRVIAQRALSALQRANENIIGGVLNRIPKNQKNSYQFVGVDAGVAD